MREIILASRSPRRRFLLKRSGINITIRPSTVKESPRKNLPVEHYAVSLALAKAENIAGKLHEGLVIGADTIVVYKNRIFGKPRNAKDAEKILRTLSNTRHSVFTAIAVIDARTKKRFVDIDESIVITRKISPKVIQEFARKNHDKAGAYAVQEDNDRFVKEIQGDYYNVVGLPLHKLKDILRIFSVKMRQL